MLNFRDIKGLRYFIILLGMVFMLFVYGGSRGWRFIGSDVKKWHKSEEEDHHHK